MIRPPTDPKGYLCSNLRYLFWLTNPNAPLAPIYTNLEGGARAGKTWFCGHNFPKNDLKRLFWPVFSKFCLRRKKFDKNRVYVMLWESSEDRFGRPKKRSTKFSNFFLKSAPSPLEKILDPHLYLCASQIWTRLVFIKIALINEQGIMAEFANYFLMPDFKKGRILD